jgi:hypothetical protein
MKNYCEDFSECETNAKSIDTWQIAGCGETLEKNWYCEKCGRSWREVYIFACTIDNETEEELKMA